MSDTELIQAINSLSVETGSLACLGCGYEHHCGIHGCAIMRAAVDRLEQLTAEPPNDPLTREELDSLNGAWVWVVAEEDPEPIHMQINTDSGTAAPSCAEYCTFDNYGPGTKGYYGWIAYRKKPETAEVLP